MGQIVEKGQAGWKDAIEKRIPDKVGAKKKAKPRASIMLSEVDWDIAMGGGAWAYWNIHGGIGNYIVLGVNIIGTPIGFVSYF